MIRDIVKRIKYTKLDDWISIMYFLLAYPIALLLKQKHKKIWLVCEDRYEARDNGYCFFKYVCENHPEQEIVYAIDKKSHDYMKVAKIGKVISYGGFIHWVYYLAAQRNISSQKSGKPNAALCYFLEVYGILKNSRIFLQHGITINNGEWLHYKNTKFDLFICGAKLEYDYILRNFGYPIGRVKYTGFSRFDRLYNVEVKFKRILIMPSWREWLTDIVRDYADNEEIGKKFTQTEYFKRWQELLSSKQLESILENNNLEVIFYPHRNMQKYLHFFKADNKRIHLAKSTEWDVQDLLKTSSLLVTDYSSVFFDFVYMKKPVVFYQFDVDMFRKYQYQDGWFDYEHNDFGSFCKTTDKCIEVIKFIVNDNFCVSKNFNNVHKNVFPLFDHSNCKRIYEVIRKLDKDAL